METTSQPRVSMKSLFNGVPFLCNEFDSKNFLTAICAIRLQHAKRLGWPHDNPYLYFDPSNATKLVLSHCVGNNLETIANDIDKKTTAVNEGQQLQINGIIKKITQLIPTWTTLFSLPVQYKVFIDENIASFSNFIKPQHIFLSKNIAFRNEVELAEQVIHESTHVWLYLIEELWRYHENDEDNLAPYHLPTGAKNKTATEILSAGYVVTVLTEYYSKLDKNKWSERIDFLTDYRLCCVEQILKCHTLTDLGREVLDTLENYRYVD